MAEEKAEIGPNGRVVGDIWAPRIIIRDGAAFRGKIEMENLDFVRDPVSPDASSHKKTSPLESLTFSPDEPVEVMHTEYSDLQSSVAETLLKVEGSDKPPTHPDQEDPPIKFFSKKKR